jgi:hypothetical protein
MRDRIAPKSQTGHDSEIPAEYPASLRNRSPNVACGSRARRSEGTSLDVSEPRNPTSAVRKR